MPQSEELSAFLELRAASRRYSKSTLDVFNLRDEKLSTRYKSSPGLYSAQHQKSLESVLSASVAPKSILVKKNLPLAAPAATKSLEEKDEKAVSHFSLGLELQFTTFVLVCFILIIVIPLSMIIIGSIYVTSCPRQVMIPVFLIVCGSSFLASIFLLRKLNRRRKDTEFDRSCYKSTFSSVLLLQIGWFIAGCIWIYGSFEPDYNAEDSPLFCHRTLYLYSFWLLNTLFLTTALAAILFAVYIFARKEPSVDSPTTV